MYITPVQYKEHTYPSAESAYQCACARFHGDEALALQIQSEKDPYVVKKKLSRRIRITDEWSNKKLQSMKEIVKSKFYSNDTIRNKLLNTKGLLFEATTDRDFGCGFTLAALLNVIGLGQSTSQQGIHLGRFLFNTESHTTAAVQRVKHETSLTFAYIHVLWTQQLKAQSH